MLGTPLPSSICLLRTWRGCPCSPSTQWRCRAATRRWSSSIWRGCSRGSTSPALQCSLAGLRSSWGRWGAAAIFSYIIQTISMYHSCAKMPEHSLISSKTTHTTNLSCLLWNLYLHLLDKTSMTICEDLTVSWRTAVWFFIIIILTANGQFSVHIWAAAPPVFRCPGTRWHVQGHPAMPGPGSQGKIGKLKIEK